METDGNGWKQVETGGNGWKRVETGQNGWKRVEKVGIDREWMGMDQITLVKRIQNDRCFDTLSNGKLNYRELPFGELSFGELKYNIITYHLIIGRIGAFWRVIKWRVNIY